MSNSAPSLRIYSLLLQISATWAVRLHMRKLIDMRIYDQISTKRPGIKSGRLQPGYHPPQAFIEGFIHFLRTSQVKQFFRYIKQRQY